jgi:hypothetical protein
MEVPEGEEVGAASGGCGMYRDSGRFNEGGMGSDKCETGTMPSGVDCSEPLEAKGEDADEGLLRAEGMVMAEVILENEGLGERPRETRALGASP